MDKKVIEQIQRRTLNAQEVIFVFEQILKGQKTIQIYNEIRRNNRNSKALKKKVEVISSGNVKVDQSELSSEQYTYLQNLRSQVYEYHRNNKINKVHRTKEPFVIINHL